MRTQGGVSVESRATEIVPRQIPAGAWRCSFDRRDRVDLAACAGQEGEMAKNKDGTKKPRG